MPAYGVDVSVIQQKLPLQAMKDADLVFVYSRCQVGNNNPGRDPMFEPNVVGARAVDVFRGGYFFPFPLPHLEPIAQADMFLRSAMVDGHPVGAEPGELPPAYDLEWPPPEDWAKKACTADQIVDWSLTCLARIASGFGQAPVIYSYPYFLQALSKAKRYAELMQYKLWIAGGAGYLTRTERPDYAKEQPPIVPGWGRDWLFHQWNGNNGARLPNGVDADFDGFNGSLEDLAALCHENPVDTAPELDPAVIAAQASSLIIEDGLHEYRQARADAMLAAV